MRIPLEIAFRGMPRSEDIETLIQRRMESLERACEYMVSCRVVVEKAQSEHAGNPYRVRIDMRIPPGHELVVAREPSQGTARDPLPAALRAAFRVARRRLQQLVERERGQVKTHPEQETMAVVDRLFPDEGYGFLRTLDGHSVYFHRNSVLNDDFDRLEVGTGVRFAEEEGVEGPQASTVQIVDKPSGRASARREVAAARA